MLDVICDFINIIVDGILKYIQENSIDFIAIIASIVIAIQTDKWIDNRKNKEQRGRILIEMLDEINHLLELLKSEEEKTNNNIHHDRLTLNLYPYEMPLWESVKNTENINILSKCNGYKESLIFYENLNQLNEWENLLTNFMLFSTSNSKETYQDLLLKQIIKKREKCITFAKEAIDKLMEEN